MNYCVIKNTTIVIDGSKNPIEAMLQNAQNAGLNENEVEILSEKEFESRVEAEPTTQQPPSDKERIDMLEDMALLMMMGE